MTQIDNLERYEMDKMVSISMHERVSSVLGVFFCANGVEDEFYHGVVEEGFIENVLMGVLNDTD